MTKTNIMVKLNPWDHLRHGSAEQAFLQLREAYTCNPSPSHTMELGVAYLWAGNYPAAWEHFVHAIETDRTPGDGLYGMAGVAQWCIDEPGAAVRHWRAGLDAPYAVGGAGIHLPLLLFVASILRPGVYPKKEAEGILMRKVEDPRVKYWPGPLAQFVLGLVDQKSLAEHSIGNIGLNERSALPHRKRLIGFYEGIRESGRGNLNPVTFRELMRKMVDTSQPEWSEQRYFLYLLRSEEFFIARHEASLPLAS